MYGAIAHLPNGANFRSFRRRSCFGSNRTVCYSWQVTRRLRDPEQFLPGATLAIVLLWLGGFLLCYGVAAWRTASFSLLFLLLMVPLPPTVLERSIHVLQQGSTEIAYLLFKAVGVPVLRQGFILAVPVSRLRWRKECSGIRSSVALFITCLLAAHLFLKSRVENVCFSSCSLSRWLSSRTAFVSPRSPLLSVYVDPGFLTGRLHHEGGFVFFLLALAILAPVLMFLQRSEKKTVGRDGTVPRETENGLAPG